MKIISNEKEIVERKRGENRREGRIDRERER